MFSGLRRSAFDLKIAPQRGTILRPKKARAFGGAGF
jgi:hypothetical protein